MSGNHEWGRGQPVGSQTVVQEQPKAPSSSAPASSAPASSAPAPSAPASSASTGGAQVQVDSIRSVGGKLNPTIVSPNVNFSVGNVQDNTPVQQPGNPTPGGGAPVHVGSIGPVRGRLNPTIVGGNVKVNINQVPDAPSGPGDNASAEQSGNLTPDAPSGTGENAPAPQSGNPTEGVNVGSIGPVGGQLNPTVVASNVDFNVGNVPDAPSGPGNNAGAPGGH